MADKRDRQESRRIGIMMKSGRSNKAAYLFILCSLFISTPILAQEGGAVPRGMKGNYELDLFTQAVSRRVVEEVGPGEDFSADADSTRVMLRLSIKPLRALELYIQGGAANLKIDEFDGYGGDYSLAYGGGFMFRLYESLEPERFRFALFGDALTFTTDDRVMTTIQSVDLLVDEEIEWLEYTIGGVGIWRVNNWEPYFGVRFSWLDSTDKIRDPRVGEINLEEDDNLGLVFGTDVYFDPGERIALNLEGTLMDQSSLKIGVKLWY